MPLLPLIYRSMHFPFGFVCLYHFTEKYGGLITGLIANLAKLYQILRENSKIQLHLHH
ncbi:MAG TPA: hypothetical protein PLZ78_15920 [Spirochaetota bacterium]|nr:hypothetical protein [Spirochaetota bacterium]